MLCENTAVLLAMGTPPKTKTARTAVGDSLEARSKSDREVCEGPFMPKPGRYTDETKKPKQGRRKVEAMLRKPLDC